MIVPTVPATTARRSCLWCSESERPRAAPSAVVIRILPFVVVLYRLSQRRELTNYRTGRILSLPASNRRAARPHQVMVIRRVEPALSCTFAGERRADKDQCGARDAGGLHLVANIAERAADQTFVGPAHAIGDDDGAIAAI